MPPLPPSFRRATPSLIRAATALVAPLAAALFLLAAATLPGCTKSPGPSSSGAVETQPAKADHGTPQAAAGLSQSKAKAGCAADDKACQRHLETAILAGGCFWGMEELMREVPGVVDTEVGYTGGNVSTPRYEDVKTGDSGHAESVRVVFDSRVISYETLLEKWFFRMHDPTTENRQGNDRGSQYRSAIFTNSEAQRKAALAVIKRVDASGKWSDSIVTEIVDATPFTRAEDYHQDYLQKSPNGYTCHYLRD